MDSAILSLLGAFVLSILGLFAFIWSLRKGLLVENPAGAGVIFARGEIGQIDDPALGGDAHAALQDAASTSLGAPRGADPDEFRALLESVRLSAISVLMSC